MATAVLRTGALGDVLLVRPLLQRLAAAGTRPVLLAPGGRGRLAAEGLARALDLDRAEAAWLYAGAGAPPPPLRTALAGCREALVFHAPAPEVETALCRLGLAAVRFHPANPPAGGARHAAEHLLQAAAGPGGHAPAPPLLTGDAAAAARILAAAQLAPAETVILHPGSGSPRKNLPLAFFAELGRALCRDGWTGAAACLATAGVPVPGRAPLRAWEAETRPQRLAVVAGEADADLGARLAKRLPGSVQLPSLSLPELAGVLHLAAGCIGNDSGVCHLAGQAGARTLACFRATDPRVWAPLGPRVAVADCRGLSVAGREPPHV
jgi:ADP-heptose:LPS heptosyltransferase